MKSIDFELKNRAIKEIVEKNRLISDVANEYGIATKKLYELLKERQNSIHVRKFKLQHQVQELQNVLATLKDELAALPELE